MTPTKPLSDKDLEEARRRAEAAGELPENVRKELISLWKRQDALPKDLRKLSLFSTGPSGWVLEHVVPKLCLQLSNTLRASGTYSGEKCATRLELVSEYVLEDVSKAIALLTEPAPAGDGSRLANNSNATVLRVIDFGLLGLHHVAAVMARTNGVLDTSTVLVADGHLTVHQAILAAEKLDDKVFGKSTKADKESVKIELPLELFSPDDFNSVRIE